MVHMFLKNKAPSTSYLIFRALLPTAASLMASSFMAVAVIVAHVIVISLNNHVYPQILDSSVVPEYHATFIDPITRIMTNTTLNNGLGMLLWGIFGYVLYACIAAVTTSVREWRVARSEVRIAAGTIIQSPMHKSVLTRTIWRLAVGVLFVAFTIAIAPVMRHCLSNDYRILLEPTFSSVVKYSLITIALWMAVFHGYLILLRLYVMRTRVFGEIIY